ncbi:MAG: translation initiation factor IF-2 subunit alpha [Desulfurococcaceae archaeon]
MVLPRKELPDQGELTIATVKDIHEFGAYVTLDEYADLKAFLPWSEVSSKWIRDIREVIREGQKIVVKVIRVDKGKKEVDVSLKRVSDTEKQRKMLWWKRYSKACKIVELVAEKIGRRVEDAYREVIWLLEEEYGDVMYALEEALTKGSKVFEEAGIPEDWHEPLLEEVRRHVRVKEVVVKYKVFLQSLSSDGVERIKKCLEAMASYLESAGVRYRLYVAGSPKYVLEVYSEDYRAAEKHADEAVKVGQEMASKLEVLYRAEREKT